MSEEPGRRRRGGGCFKPDDDVAPQGTLRFDERVLCTRSVRCRRTGARRLHPRTGVATMGLLDLMLGNASEIPPEKVTEEFERILGAGERVERAYKLVRDLIVFTDVRLILVDKQGMTSSKVEYHSVPYRS